MKFIYGCQRIGRHPETGRLEHQPPIIVAEGDEVLTYDACDILGPSTMLTNRERQPEEVAACKDHVHSIWLQTRSVVVPSEEPHPDSRRKYLIYVCGIVAHSDPGTYEQGAVVFEDRSGQRCAYSIVIAGPSRVVYDEHNPVNGYCPCGKNHPHRMWIETDASIEVMR